MSHDLSGAAYHAHHVAEQREATAKKWADIRGRIERLQALKSQRGLTSNERLYLESLIECQELDDADGVGKMAGWVGGVTLAALTGLTGGLAAIPILAAGFVGGGLAQRIKRDSQSDKAPELCFTDGSLSYELLGNDAKIKVAKIRNRRNGGKSGSLRLNLFVTTTAFCGNTLKGHFIAEARLDQLEGGYKYTEIERTVPYTRPPSGDYFVTLFLEEYTRDDKWSWFDYWTFDNMLSV